MAKKAAKAIDKVKLPTCGVVMPIAGSIAHAKSGPIEYSAQHWLDVRALIYEAIDGAKFKPNLVSFADETKVIHDTIINNLYKNEMVVVDVSSRNPNVMFELGMRLTFNLPVVIIVDDSTDYAFDVGLIEHVIYRRDLRYRDTNEFRDSLAKKIKSTYEASTKADYKPFLKHFQILDVTGLETRQGDRTDLVLKRLDEMEAALRAKDRVKEQSPPVLNTPQRDRIVSDIYKYLCTANPADLDTNSRTKRQLYMANQRRYPDIPEVVFQEWFNAATDLYLSMHS